MRIMTSVVVILFLGITGALLWGSTTEKAGATSPKSFDAIEPRAFQGLTLKKEPKPVILDVRTPEEYAGGHLVNAILIDFYSDDFRAKLDQLDKSQVYLVYCRSGNRSGQALNIMKKLGFKKAYHMAGGIVRWVAEGLPVE